ncbi:hypothetical protein QUQ16_000192 [Escherichia coli]|nr:hypothetical protein [Escherichia coli]
MTPEQLSIYNKNRIKKGLPTIYQVGDSYISTDSDDDAISDFSKYGEVTPYTTGLLTNVFNSSSLGKGEFNTQDFEKNIKQELDNISTSTQYLFDAVDAAQEAYTNAQQAASDAAAAQSTANDAYNQALANAQDIVTIKGDISDINTTIGSMDITIDGMQTQISGIVTDVSTNTGDISTITGQIEVMQPEIDSNTQGVNDYYNVWGVKTDASGMTRGAAFIQNQASPGDAAFIVDANFAVVNGDTNTPVLTIDAGTGELVFNGTVPGLSDAIQEAEDAYNTAEQAQNTAINALNSAAATSSATIASTINYGTFDHTITVVDNKDVSRTITLLPVIVSALSDNNDEANIWCTIWVNGVQTYSESVDFGYNVSSTLVGSWSGTMNPGSGNLSIRVQMGVGGNTYGNVSSISGMTVLATQHQESDFIVA